MCLSMSAAMDYHTSSLLAPFLPSSLPPIAFGFPPFSTLLSKLAVVIFVIELFPLPHVAPFLGFRSSYSFSPTITNVPIHRMKHEQP